MLIYDRKYYIAYHKAGKDWIQCHCGRIHEEKGLAACPYCGDALNDRIDLPFGTNSYVLFNTSVYLYEEEDYIKLTFSMTRVNYGVEKPIYYNKRERLSIKFYKNRRSLLCRHNLTDNSRSFNNVTCTFINFEDNIYMPDDLWKMVGEKIYGPADVKDFYDLIWLNRTRGNYDEVKDVVRSIKGSYSVYSDDYEIAAGKRNLDDIIYKLNRAIDKEEPLRNIKMLYGDFSALSNNLSSLKHKKRDIKNLKKLLSTEGVIDRHKVGEIICRLFDVDYKAMPPAHKKIFMRNMGALGIYKELTTTFTNLDILRNVIDKAASSRSLITVNLSDKEQLWASRKITSPADITYLADTLRMMKKLKNNDIAFSTKGTIKELHDRCSKLMIYVTYLRASFIHTLDIEDEVLKEGYVLKYGKNPLELAQLGSSMHICVGGYYDDCLRSRRYGSDRDYITFIFYIENEGKPVACCEMVNGQLVQAKGFANKRLPRNLQEMIIEYCESKGITISTDDIDKKVKAA